MVRISGGSRLLMMMRGTVTAGATSKPGVDDEEREVVRAVTADDVHASAYSISDILHSPPGPPR
jgi:hypothetical protein